MTIEYYTETKNDTAVDILRPHTRFFVLLDRSLPSLPYSIADAYYAISTRIIYVGYVITPMKL